MAQEKQYGLIIPGKKKGSEKGKPKNVFGDDSSEEEGESNVDWLKQSLKSRSHGSMQQKASVKVMREALAEDPSVYAYDEVYDEMSRKKEEAVEQKKADKKPKYIDSLLKTAKQRELENELRKEREAQREREKEGDMFADKEAFVTSAYKKKMEEVRKMQEDQAYHDAIDDITDVTKQQDISGFYRQLYKDRMKELPESTAPSQPAEDNVEIAQETTKDDTSSPVKKESESTTPTRRSPSPPGSPNEHRGNAGSSSKLTDRNKEDRKDSRSHHDHRSRRRSRSRSHERGRVGESRRNDSRSHRRDRSRDRERDRGRYYNSDKRRKSRSRSPRRERHHQERKNRSRSRSAEGSRRHRERRERDREENRDKRPERTEKEKEEDKQAEDAKIKIIQKENWYDFDVEIERDVKKDFYAKRTVGNALEEALQRYMARKGTTEVITYK